MRATNVVVLLALAAGLVTACGGCQSETVQRGVEQGPVADACSERLHTLVEHLLTYYVRHGSMPEALEDLVVSGHDAALVTCPLSGKVYSYSPAAVSAAGMQDAVLVWDSDAVHGGRRRAIVIERRRGRQPLVLNVVDLPMGWVPPVAQGER